ncbi:hypothetical protein QM467_08830 [Rhodoblastus sp. 17X3]|uniref:hypothetical protein n=1 Tax=Rhodoblastus sp. 17X3 TaxID=3047026 RepID=UPI0024B73B19|nr:hypothetical protein [Rhodoblastus sp. 17X3]MDI9848153.1 hypothetical protein [Rhodoblastus sp. 17X3]
MLKKSKGGVGDPAALSEVAPEQDRPVAPAGQDFTYGQDFSYNDDDDDDDGEIETDSAEDTARYIADMIASLAYIAREARFDLLSYLLDMARVEAEMQARQSETPLDDD